MHMNMKLKLFIVIALLHSMTLIVAADEETSSALREPLLLRDDQQQQPEVPAMQPVPLAAVVVQAIAQQPQPIMQQPVAAAVVVQPAVAEQDNILICCLCLTECFFASCDPCPLVITKIFLKQFCSRERIHECFE